MQISSNRLFFLIFIATCLLNSPLFFVDRDMWDGVIYSAGNELGNFENIKLFSLESGWFLQYPFSFFLGKISHHLNVSFKTVNIFVQIFSLSLSCFIFLQILRSKFDFKESQILFSLIYFLTFPIWHIFMSSVTCIYIFSVCMGMLSIYLLISKSILKNIFGFFTLTIAAQLYSQLLFLPAFLYAIDIARGSYKPTLKTIIIGLYCSLLIYFRTVVFKPYGMYEGYNKIILPSDLNNLITLSKSLIGFASYLLPIILVLLIANRAFKIKDFKCLISYRQLFISFLLLSFGCLPYTLTGNGNKIYDTSDWDGRQIMLFTYGATFLSAIILSNLSSHLNKYSQVHHKLILYSICLALIAPNIVLMEMGYFTKLSRIIFEDKLILALKNQHIEIPKGNVLFLTEFRHSPGMRPYEVNYLLLKATGNLNHWGVIAPINSPPDTSKYLNDLIPPIFKENVERYKLMYLYDFNPNSCLTIINVSNTNFFQLYKRVYYSLFPDKMLVSVSSNKTVCPE